MSFVAGLRPTEEQEQMMIRHCADARYVWNLALEHQNISSSFNRYPSPKEWSGLLTEARKGSWLGEGSSSVQHQALRQLNQAFKNWWKRPDHFGRPTWRSSRNNNSFEVRDISIAKLSSKYGEITIPKCGRVKFRWSYPWNKLMDVKSATVKLRKDGRWIIGFRSPQPAVPRSLTGKSIGIDMGVVNTLALSDGSVLNSPAKLTPQQARRSKLLQRKHSRSKKGSKRREATRLKLAKLHQRQVDIRKNWIEKTTTNLVKENDLIVIEDLSVAKMVAKSKSVNLNRNLLNESLGLLARRLQDKAEATEGVELIKVNPAYTSQRCNACSYTHKKNRENQAIFECQKCRYKDNADLNAAKNILAAGLAVTGHGRDLIDISRPDEVSTDLTDSISMCYDVDYGSNRH